jgi:hypothetical protein
MTRHLATGLTLLASAMVASGCIAYVPTEQHTEPGAPRMVSVTDIGALVAGQTTRTDVLLRFGAPARSTADDRFFIYHWTEVSGYLVIAGGGPGGGTAVGIPFSQDHDLCIEFTNSGRMRTVANIESGVGKDSAKSVEQWLASASRVPAAP